MGFLSFKKNSPTKHVEHEKIFNYLTSITENNEATEKYFDSYNQIGVSSENFDTRLIHLYLTWEDFIETQSTLDDNNNHETLREQIIKKVDIKKIDKKFRLLFVDKRTQALYVYEIFIQYIVSYIIKNTGTSQLESIINDTTYNNLFEFIDIDSNGFVFDRLNTEVTDKNISFDQLRNNFKNLYTSLFNIISNLYGEKVAAGFFNRIYKTLQQIYNREIAAVFLQILPEQVLGLDDWLSTLSKEELEKQVEEKTRELNDLNESLEVKVKERTRELEEAYEELKQLDIKKSEFISVAAHQLRTPLSGFKWTFEMLLKKELGELSDEQNDILKKTADTNNRMINIVNDLLNTDLIVTGKTTFESNPVSLNKILDDILFEIESILHEKNVTVDRSDDPITIAGDRKKLFAVFQNIIDNAVKYTSENDTVTIKLSQNESCETVLTVADSGIGIPEAEQEQIFERFYRANNAMRTHANGSGLGLFIAKNIVEGHGGTISFSSEEGVGTTFTVILPESCNLSEKKVQ